MIELQWNCQQKICFFSRTGTRAQESGRTGESQSGADNVGHEKWPNDFLGPSSLSVSVSLSLLRLYQRSSMRGERAATFHLAEGGNERRGESRCRGGRDKGRRIELLSESRSVRVSWIHLKVAPNVAPPPPGPFKQSHGGEVAEVAKLSSFHFLN